jgi:hypothetical protein
MGYFAHDDADKYGGGGGDFFSLKDDGDMAVRRYMYQDIDDIRGIAVHQLEDDNGNKRYVSCLRNYNDPVDVCPCCAASMRIQAKIFVVLWDDDTEQYQIWERGKTYISRLASLAGRYNPLYKTRFEIERSGKKGDTKTTYENYPVDKDPEFDDVDWNDFPEPPDALGTIVLDWTADDMDDFLQTGEFPGKDEDEKPKRRETTKRNSASSRRKSPAKSRNEEPEDEEVPDENEAEEKSAPTSRRRARRGSR